MPNIGVGATGLRNGIERPHAIFLLKDSVYCGPKAQVKFQAKMDGIARRIVAAMIPLGADPGGLANSCKSKNPLSPAWSHRVMREEPWTLTELETALPVPVSQRQLDRKYAAYLTSRVPKAGVAPDHADPVVASASNQAHRHVCKGAQVAVRQFRATGTYEGFRAHVLELAIEVCPDPESAVRKADYVAPWTWSKFTGRVPGQKLDPVALKAARGETARKLNWNRKVETMKAVLSAYAALSAELGRKPRLTEVAAWAGVSEPTARLYRPATSNAPVSQQNIVISPEKPKIRQGVVKKDLDILGDGKEMEAVTTPPVVSPLTGPSFLDLSDALPNTRGESIPAPGTSIDTVLPIPVAASPAVPVSIIPNPQVPAAPPVAVADAPAVSAPPLPLVPVAPGSRRMLPPPFARAFSNPGRSFDVMPTRPPVTRPFPP